MVNLKFQLFSDIHLELSKSVPKIPQLAPYLFLAGDIGKINGDNFKDFIEYAHRQWTKIFYVCGNHEYYSSNIPHDKLISSYRDFFSSYSNVIFLDNSSYELVINGKISGSSESTETYESILIYGTTLWSYTTQTMGLNDFSMIKMFNNNELQPIDLEYFNNLNSHSIEQIVQMIKNINQTDMKLIIITHFPPLPNTSHPKYKLRPEYISEYFANNLVSDRLLEYGIDENEFYSKIKLWMSGHTHYSYDFEYKGTRFLSNQIGYIGEQSVTNPKYDGMFEIDL